MDNSRSAPRAVSILALIGFGIWTLLGLGGWVFVSFGGNVMQAVIERIFWSDPDMGRLVGAVVRIVEGLGASLVVIVWAIGAALIWAGWALLRRLARAHVAMAEAHFEARGFDDEPSGWGPRPMKDVTPPREPPPLRSLPPR